MKSNFRVADWIIIALGINAVHGTWWQSVGMLLAAILVDRYWGAADGHPAA